MISYSHPLCPITQKPATMFCFTDSCNKPAFACKKSELSSHKHGLGGRCYFWEEILPAIQTIMEKGLLPDDINALQKQEKQIHVLVQQLQTILKKHRENIQICRQRQKSKGEIENVVRALREGAINSITGADMALLVKAIESNDVFVNKQVVQGVIGQENDYINKLLTKVRSIINEYNSRQSAVRDLINTQPRKIVPIVDLKNSNVAVINDGAISIETVQNLIWHSVFAKEPLLDGQSFEVLVISPGVNSAIGVATSDLRNQPQQSWFSLCLHCFCKYGSQITSIKAGDKLTVRRNGNQIQWDQNGTFLHQTKILNELQNRQLFPVLQFYSQGNPGNLGQMRFI